MPVFTSKTSTNSDNFVKNRAEMLSMVDELRTLEARG